MCTHHLSPPFTPQLLERPARFLPDWKVCKVNLTLGPRKTLRVLPWPNLQVTGQVLEICFQNDRKIMTILKDLPQTMPLCFYGKNMNIKQHLFRGKKISPSLCHKALNLGLPGINFSSSWLEQKRRICWRPLIILFSRYAAQSPQHIGRNRVARC